MEALINNEKNRYAKRFYEQLFNDGYIVTGDSRYTNNHGKVNIQHVNESCGNYEWGITPLRFVHRNQRCPKCSGNAKKNIAIFKEEVKAVVGKEYSVIGEYVNDSTHTLIRHNSKVCKQHEWKISPSNFLSGHRCPVCSIIKLGEKRRKKHGEYVNEVFELVGNEYTVLGIYVHQNIKIRFRHNNEDCNNHEWEVRPDSFTFTGNRCPACRHSKGEKRIYEYLTKENKEFVTQYQIKECRNKKVLPFDFAIMKNGVVDFLIEYNGEQHYRAVGFFGGDTTLRYIQGNDEIKRSYCKNNNIDLVEISYEDFDNIEKILNKIFLS